MIVFVKDCIDPLGVAVVVVVYFSTLCGVVYRDTRRGGKKGGVE